MSLVEFIRNKTATIFRIEVAAYPESAPPGAAFEADLGELHPQAAKSFGAQGAINPVLFTARLLFLFLLIAWRKAGVDIPSFPGIHADSPITARIGAFLPTACRRRNPPLDSQATGVLR